MSVASPFIHRPIATSLLGVAAMLGGMLGYWWLPISALPQVDFPTIQVTTQFPGANPDTVVSLITAPLEGQLGKIPALETMTSSSAFGISQITLQFDLSRDIDDAAQDVQSAINAATSILPRNLPYPPLYSKVNPADAPIITLALTSKTIDLRALSDLADTILAPRLSEITGVGRASIQGGIRPAIRIQADLSRLAAYGIGFEDLRAAIVGANVAGPKGSLDGAHQSYSIAANDQISSAETYKNVTVAFRNGAPVSLSDLADVVEGLENNKVTTSYQSKPAIVIDIQRQPGANVIETVRRIRAELPRLQHTLPRDVQLTIVNDRTDTIRASIQDMQFTLILSVALVVLVVLIFLRTIRATVIAGVVLPLSLITTFGVMWFCGFSFDNLSLMALTIGIGFVVDDAIVMIENIVRHMEKGESALNAAIRGAGEISFTVISLTMSLIAVFIPLLFMSGLVGRMFREFALTLTIAVVASAIISLTLTPMMCARLLRHAKERPLGALLQWVNAQTEIALNLYCSSLQWVLKHQRPTLIVTLTTLLATIMLYVVIPKGFIPAQDTGLLIAVTEAGKDVSFNEMATIQRKIEAAIRADSDVTSVVSIVGVSPLNTTSNNSRMEITLRPRNQRISNIDDVVARLKNRVTGIPGVTVYFQTIQDLQISTRRSRAQFQYTLISTNRTEVVEWAGKLVDKLRSARALSGVNADTQESGPRMEVEVDREQAGRLGVSMQSVADTLNDAFGQRQVSTIYGQANQYRVILEAQPRYQRDPSALAQLYVTGAHTSTGTTATTGNTAIGGANTNVSATPNSVTGNNQVMLAAFAHFVPVVAPLVIAHQQQFPAVTISFDLNDGFALSDAVAAISVAQRDIGMPSTVTGNYAGDAAEFSKSLASEPWFILAAIITIYIVLGVLYESFIHPLTILSTLPSAGVGALLALMLCRHDLSIIALIGIVLLMGIAKKNAILMIDFALEAERTLGLSPEQSITQAALLRFRPIMMTTLAALFGALPLALENGAGAELRNPLGITIVGGLLLSQLLTLYTTPVIYLYMERLRARLLERNPAKWKPVRRQIARQNKDSRL